MKIFVLLTPHLDAADWAARYERGLVPDRSPYGYHHAISDGHSIAFSSPTVPKGVVGLFQKAIRWLFGFDLVHVVSNLPATRQYDVIWTHTEREHLGLEFLRWISLGRLVTAPVISQSIWLMDEWPRMSFLKRWFVKKLTKRADVLTFHSLANASLAEREGLHPRCLVVPFGISMDSFPVKPPAIQVPLGRPIRVFALGNDRHRDWDTFIAAFSGDSRFEVQVASATFPKDRAADNITVDVRSQAELAAGYDWADVIVVPLTHNLHASGLTVTLEAVASGIPLVASDTGGLRTYFDEPLARYVPVGDSARLREAVATIFDGDEHALSAALRAAQARLVECDYTTRGFARRHVELSEELLGASTRLTG